MATEINIISGNMVAFIGSLVMAYSYLKKDRYQILLIQVLSSSCFAVSSILLGSLPGCLISIIAALRCLLAYKNKLNKVWIVSIITASIIIGFFFNNLGIIGILPVAANTLFTLYSNEKSIKNFKIMMLFVIVLWLIHDAYILSLSTVVLDIISIVISVIHIKNICKEEKQTKSSENGDFAVSE